MRVLLVWPEIPTTFWSYKHAIKFISKKTVEPPLGLLTVAALLPKRWQKRLVDMNVSALRDKDILWADYVFVGGMDIQRLSFNDVLARCKTLGAKTVAGGPMCTSDGKEVENVDHLILNEAEITLSEFVADLEAGQAKSVYRSEEYADISQTPAPLWDLLNLKKYVTMDVQYSRGCPYNCEFCSITSLCGRRPRLKSPPQFLAELQSLYTLGWRGKVFIVDDNLIGNRRVLKNELLPALIQWSTERGNPFEFHAEVSIELADDEQLMQLMEQAGFTMVFVGIETPDEQSLKECGKHQNQGRDLLASVRRIHRHGMAVSGGFIVGFDHDSADIFDRQIHFIQKSGIVTAMVGLLNAMPGTLLFRRLQSENRLLESPTGDNMDGSLNFIPKMNTQSLLDGYRRVVQTIYSPHHYLERVKTLLREYRLPTIPTQRPSLREIQALFRAVWRLGIIEEGKRFFWKLLFFVVKNCPEKFALAVSLAICGFHFRKVAAEV